MRLFDAIIDANHRALTGDSQAGVRVADFAAELPVAALTCIDARLNPLFPDILGLPKEQFIWLRNAGNIITAPMSSTMRSLALACAVKGAREIAIIGHTDCLVCKTSTMKLTDAFRSLGVERNDLPQNLTEFFGLFASERQNVIKAVDIVRQSSLIGPNMPVHGLMVDTATGKLEWAVNGYQALESRVHRPSPGPAEPSGHPDPRAIGQGALKQEASKHILAFQLGEMKFPETKIGDINTASHLPAPQPPAIVAPAPANSPSPHHPSGTRPASPSRPHAPLPMPARIPVPPPRIRGR